MMLILTNANKRLMVHIEGKQIKIISLENKINVNIFSILKRDKVLELINLIIKRIVKLFMVAICDRGARTVLEVEASFSL